MLQKAYADFAKAKLAPRTFPGIIELLGHAGVLVAAKQAEPGALVSTKDFEDRDLDTCQEIMRTMLYTTSLALAAVHEAAKHALISPPGTIIIQVNNEHQPSVQRAVRLCNLTCYSAWALEAARDIWYPTPQWPEFSKAIDQLVYLWEVRKPKRSELGKKRELVHPEYRSRLWWNYKGLWTGSRYVPA